MIAKSVRWLLRATLLAPLVVFPGFLFPFVTIRAVYFRVLVEIAAALLLYLVLRRELVVSFRRDVVFWALVAWIGANALAAAFGVAPMRSVFGDHERMGGVWLWIHLLAYYVALRTVLHPEDWWRFLRTAIAVAAIVAGYGLVQFWFRPFSVGIGGVEVGSTIGNGGLLAVYLLANVAFCAVLAIHARSRARIAYVAIALLLTVALVFSGNRSSILALLVGAGVAVPSYAAWSGSLRGRRAWVAAAIFAAAVALPFAARLTFARPVTQRIPVLGKLASGVDSSRVIQWRAAVEGIRERPLLGVGPENYQVIWSQYQHPEMHRFIADSRWDRAHNAYLDAFATAGIFGFLALLAVWASLGWSAKAAAVRSASANASLAAGEPPGAVEGVALGFFVAYAFYLFFWFFDLNSTMLWIALAAFVASRATGSPFIEFGAPREKRWQSSMVLVLGAAALAAVLYVHGFETLRMARTLNQAHNPDRPLQQVLADYESVFGSPAPVTQHAFLMYAGRLRDLLPEFPEIRNVPAQAELFDRAFVLAITEFERQARQDPLNERVLVQHARVLMLGAYYYGNARLYESALAKLERAVELSPRRVNTILALGVAYLNASRTREAMDAFQRAYSLYPPIGQTHSYIAETYATVRDYASAAVWLRSALALGHSPDRDLVQTVIDFLAAEGNARLAASLAFDFLQARLGPPFMWAAEGFVHPSEAHGAAVRIGTDLLATAREDSLLANRTAELLVAAGDSARAAVIRDAAPSLCRRPVHLRSLAAGPSRNVYYVRVAACGEPWRLGDVSR